MNAQRGEIGKVCDIQSDAGLTYVILQDDRNVISHEFVDSVCVVSEFGEVLHLKCR
jgi:hypothetical protein